MGTRSSGYNFEQTINELYFYFKKLWKESKPLAKLFRTSSHSYLYDTGTNKIFRCDEIVASLLEMLLSMEINQVFNSFISVYGKHQFIDAANQIKRAIEKGNILMTTRASQFGLSNHYRNFEELVNSSLGILILEVTEKCNLRCEYCIYNPRVRYMRNHGKRNMNLSIAKSAIDYLKKHSFKRDKVAVTFYGGEPLLRFPFIDSCVKYAKSVLKNKEVSFSITTNGTLLTYEIAEYFLKNNFSAAVSIDGPQDIHDSYRKDIKGNGSFKKAIIGLKNLIDVYGEVAKERVSLVMVYTPPFTESRITRIAELWDEIPWLSKEIEASISYPSRESLPKERLLNNFKEEDKGLVSWAYEKFQDSFMEKGSPHPLVRSIVERELALIVQRPIFDKPLDKYPLNGCCVPGARRLFVSTTGTFHICERVPTIAPSIGNVYSGVDINVIKNIYIDEYEKMSLPICSQCWAIRLCSFCYSNVEYVKTYGKTILNRRENTCIAFRSSKEKLLKLFCELIEKDSKRLDYFYEFKLE